VRQQLQDGLPLAVRPARDAQLPAVHLELARAQAHGGGGLARRQVVHLLQHLPCQHALLACGCGACGARCRRPACCRCSWGATCSCRLLLLLLLLLRPPSAAWLAAAHSPEGHSRAGRRRDELLLRCERAQLLPCEQHALLPRRGGQVLLELLLLLLLLLELQREERPAS
jgi:hypothetical protein